MNKLAALLSLVAIFLSLWGSAQAGDDAPYVVEMAIFTCPFCFELEKHTGAIEDKIGERFVFAPVPLNDDNNAAVRVYYALRDEVDQRELRAALFDLLRVMRYTPSDVNEIVEFLRLRGMDIDASATYRKAYGNRVTRAMDRAIRLAEQANVSVVPTLVVVQDGKVRSVFVKKPEQSSAQLVSKVISSIR